MAPFAVAIAVWGFVTGVAMVNSGMPIPVGLLMTLTVFAGSAQLAVLPLLGAGRALTKCAARVLGTGTNPCDARAQAVQAARAGTAASSA